MAPTPARALRVSGDGVAGIVVFRDPADLSVWRVREGDCPPGMAAPPGRTRCLIFESESVVRRVWDFPADWRRLAPEELLAVSWRR